MLFAAALVMSFLAASLMAWLVLNAATGANKEYEERYFNRTAALLSETYLFVPVERILTFKIIFCFVSGALALLLSSGWLPPVPLVVTAIAAVFGFFLPDAVIKLKVARRRAMFNSQLIDTMNTINNGLRSGFSLQQAMQLAAKQLPDPAGQEFRMAAREISLGVGVEDALQNMNKRLGDKDLQLMVAAVHLTIQTGGNLPEVFKRLCDTMRERNRLDRKISSLTSQGRLQAVIVVLIPAVMALILHLLNPEVMRLMYNTLMGWAMIAAIILLDAIGFVLIRKIVSVRM